MANNKLGRRQRALLADLATHGRGRWPEGWKQYHAHREILESLVQRGLVTSACEQAALTEAGWTQASVFTTPTRLTNRPRPQWRRVF